MRGKIMLVIVQNGSLFGDVQVYLYIVRIWQTEYKLAIIDTRIL